MDIENKTSESKDKILEMKCSLDKDGILTCNIPKEKFIELQQQNIKTKKIVYELD